VDVWDGTTGQHLLTLRAGTDSISSAAWSPDGTQVATCETTAVRLWNGSNGRQIRTLTSDRHYPQSLGWSPDGKRLATGGDDHTTKVWDSATGRELLTLAGHNDKVTSVAWSADGKWLASAGADGVVQVYATDIRDLMKLARERVSAHLSDQGCQRFLHVVRCPVFPDL
jgi:WD40 repeat protein